MRAFHHPDIKQVTLHGIMHALGDANRIALVLELACGKALNCAEAARRLKNMALSTRHHHLRILRDAGIIRSTRQGTSVMNQLRTEELNKRFPGLLAHLFSHLNHKQP